MWTVKGNYNKHGQIVYTSSPYRPAELSDGDDDDLCVWDYGHDSDDDAPPPARRTKPHREASSAHRKAGNDRHKRPSEDTVQKAMEFIRARAEAAAAGTGTGTAASGGGGAVAAPSSTPRPRSSGPSQALEQKQEADKALVEALQNLTKLSQYMLKLEVRVGKTTKEGIRQTLDDTADEAALEDSLLDSGHGLSHQELLQRVAHLSQETARRMHIVDRQWRKQSTRQQDGQATADDLRLRAEPDVKSWIKVETRDSTVAGQDPCYFTAQNLAAGRKFRDWIIYLQQLCGFQNTAADGEKLLHLAWRFLDRDLRGPTPPAQTTSVEAFVAELEKKYKGGKFDAALSDPEKRERVDIDSWRRIRQLWSSRGKNTTKL